MKDKWTHLTYFYSCMLAILFIYCSSCLGMLTAKQGSAILGSAIGVKSQMSSSRVFWILCFLNTPWRQKRWFSRHSVESIGCPCISVTGWVDKNCILATTAEIVLVYRFFLKHWRFWPAPNIFACKWQVEQTLPPSSRVLQIVTSFCS